LSQHGSIQYLITYYTLRAFPSKQLLDYDYRRDYTDAKLVEWFHEIVEVDFEKEKEENRKLALYIAEKIKNYNDKFYYDKCKISELYEELFFSFQVSHFTWLEYSSG